ncbi:AraC family transcriptional regulator [Brevibacillus sp. HB1.3]|uniref:AraC family transcriptional regulator n=1 Tax=Brevibacillus sp. HB1.3 TaxID=2738842 RepID=UPI00155424A4|nr:effector binding domain-containing protein [Brevibacillus sp. HB1.3]NQF16830.1 AraC family transcriptional regulator [Brevibacillus sp. HB1.3]
MDTYKRIQDAIDYVEEHLQEEMNITDIASRAHFSAFHFQRLFQAISGFSVQEYIRKRRLSEAALALKQTSDNVLEIAVTYQYQSQEALTRAFEKQFGITPGRYRKENHSLPYLAKMDFLAFRQTIKGEIMMNKPTITTLDDIRIIGRRFRTSLQDEQHFKDIPGFYYEFGRNQDYLRIPNKAAEDMSYGIACEFEDDGGFSFVIGEAVHQVPDELSEGFISFVLPGGKYAEFKVTGDADLVQNTRRYIYGTWLPQSNYERGEGPDFEVTDVRGSRFPEAMRVSIYIPLL